MIKLILNLIVGAVFLSSCATIVGGSKYYANIEVKDNPRANIYYLGEFKGIGSAIFKVKREDADTFNFSVIEEGFKEQIFEFKSRKLRIWPLISNWWLIFNGLPIPIGIVTDFADGALWKPDINEKNVSKMDYKNFKYLVDYSYSNDSISDTSKNTVILIHLKNGDIIKGVNLNKAYNYSYKIQTTDGNIMLYKFNEIEKISFQKLN